MEKEGNEETKFCWTGENVVQREYMHSAESYVIGEHKGAHPDENNVLLANETFLLCWRYWLNINLHLMVELKFPWTRFPDISWIIKSFR